ncbi:MAG: hypothetical protein NTX65_04835 [Ignavibacteriales bacterium]|nr:hypothetical protein [Ignavibacteriales bacterium]
MYNLFLLISGLFTFYLTGAQNIEKEFARFFTQVEEKNILSSNFRKVNTDIVKILRDGTILLVYKNEFLVERYDENNKIITHLDLKGKINFIDDVDIDSSGFFFVVNDYDNQLKKFDKNGIELKSIRVKSGQMLCLVDNELLLYNKYHINDRLHDPVIHYYARDGSFVRSFGKEPRKPKIGLIPLGAGNITYNGKDIFVCHSSDYIIDVYNRIWILTKTYKKRPTFFFMPMEINSLDEKEMKIWHRTTQLLNSYSFGNNIIVSYFERVDGTKRWLFLQNDRKSLEVLLPSTISLVGTFQNRIYFLENKKTDISSKNLPRIVSYEFQDQFFK